YLQDRHVPRGKNDLTILEFNSSSSFSSSSTTFSSFAIPACVSSAFVIATLFPFPRSATTLSFFFVNEYGKNPPPTGFDVPASKTPLYDGIARSFLGVGNSAARPDNPGANRGFLELCSSASESESSPATEDLGRSTKILTGPSLFVFVGAGLATSVL